MTESIARAVRTATTATLSTLAALMVPPTGTAIPARVQANAGGGGSVKASANRAR